MAKFKDANGTKVKAPARNGKWLYSDPAYEELKARRGNLTPAEGVRQVVMISERFSGFLLKQSVTVELKKILRALRAKKVPFVLTGAHGIASWTGRPRGTMDVDILVKTGRNYVRAVNVIKALYPELEPHNLTGVTAFIPPGKTESLIEVTFPHREDNRETLRTAIWVDDGPDRYRIPTLEAALANKYGAMLAINRILGKRAQDAIDFSWMVLHSQDEGRQPIDLERLAELGELVWPGGGGKEILLLVDKVKAGGIPGIAPNL